MRKRLLGILIIVLMLIGSLPANFVFTDVTLANGQKIVPAFPGAEGFGAYVTGGRGGEIYHVTNLNSTGPGSFYEALTTGGNTPRIIVFDVAGYIYMPDLTTSRSNITIAGQTAPGEGVTICGGTIHFKNAENIIIRYLRFRRGKKADQNDCMYIENCRNVIIDHCSFTWGGDENLSIKNSENVTVQWSIIAEGLRPHSMGGLIEWNTITLHHNLYAHNNDRNPKAKGIMEFANNVVYNWGEYSYVAGDSAGSSYANLIGNYFIAGPDTVRPQYGIVRGNANFHLYVEGNYIDSNLNQVLDGVNADIEMIDPQTPCSLVNKRFEYPRVNIESAVEAYNHVLEKAGASLSRDEIDKRIIESVRSQTGKIIEDENEVGGFIPLKSGEAPVDSDGDGMPDSWEIKNNLNPNDPTDGSLDADNDGYTNVEEYLNEIAAKGYPNENPPQTLTIPPCIIGAQIVNYKFDFGTADTPVKEGYIRISNQTPYYVGTGYGFSNPSLVGSVNRGYPDELRQDFCYPLNAGVPIEFKVDLPKGYYLIKIISGDYSAPNNCLISVEGETVLSGIYEANRYAEIEVIKEINDGQLNIVLSGESKINALEVATIPVNVLASEYQNSKILVEWNNVNGAEYYNVYRSDKEIGPYVKIGTAYENSYLDVNVQKGETYFYKITAFGNGKESAESKYVMVKFIDPTVFPPLPPTNVHIINVSPESVTIGWDKCDNTERYYIYRSLDANEPFARVGVTTATYFIDSVDTRKSYYYKITSGNAGGESGFSEVVKSPVGTPPLPPENVGCTVYSSYGTVITWTYSENAEKYNIYRKTATGEWELIGDTTSNLWVDRNVKKSENYLYAVTAVNSAGKSQKSVSIEVTISPLNLKFDFGTTTSPVAEGYIGIPNTFLYTRERGYGFVDTTKVASRNRSGPDALRQDFCFCSNSSIPITFNVDLPNGWYLVKVMTGDYSADNTSGINIENSGVEVIKTPKGRFEIVSKIVYVSDDQLNVTMSNTGRINALEVEEIFAEPIKVSTKVGVAPVLPTTVDVVYGSGLIFTSEVVWNEIDPLLYSKEGSFKVYGTIKNTPLLVEGTVTVQEAPVCMLTSPTIVEQGQEFEVMVSVYGVNDTAAIDLEIMYPKDILRYLDTIVMKNGWGLLNNVYDEVYGTVYGNNYNANEGKVRLILACRGEENTFKGGELLKVKFKSLSKGSATIEIGELILGYKDGNLALAKTEGAKIILAINPSKDKVKNLVKEIDNLRINTKEGINIGEYHYGSKERIFTPALQMASTVLNDIYATEEDISRTEMLLQEALNEYRACMITETTGDINTIRGIDIGDLALIANYYGKNERDAEWERAKIADINRDGEVGLYDLAFVAKRYLLIK